MNKMMSSSVIDQTSSLSISSQNMLLSSNAPIVDFSVGSMPANYGYDESFSKEDDEDDSNEESSQFKPRILIMGLRKSGKTSIKNVVFHKMEPNETLFLDPTTKTNLEDISCCSFITFQVYDCSGQIDLFSDPTCDYNALLKGCGSLIFVIDAQDEDQYLDAISCLAQTIFRGYIINRAIKFEVFIHKVDGFPDEKKMEIYNEIQQRATEMLIQQDSTETLIQKIYLNYHLTSIYDHSIFEAFSKVVHKLIPQHRQLERLLDFLCNSCGLERAFLFDVASKIFIASDCISPLDTQLYELCCDKIDLVLDISNIYAPKDIEGISADDSSYTCVKLNNELYLYMKQVNKFLAFVCVIRDEIFMENRGIMDYNLTLFKDSIRDILLAPQNANQNQSINNQNNTNSSEPEQSNIDSLLGNFIESQKQLGLEYLNKRLREDDKWYLVSAEWFKKWLSYIGLKKELTITACEPSSQPPGKISNKSILQKDPDTDYFFLKEGLLEEADYLTVPQELWQCLTENYTVESEEDIAERLVINDSPEGATELKIEVKLLRIIVEYKNETKVFHLSRLFKFAKLKSLLKISPEKPVRFFFKENCKQQLIDTTKSPCLSSSGAAMNDTILVDDEVPAAPGLTTRSSMRNQEASGGRHSAHKPGLCGLSNLGNTCFMNTSIQAMSNVPFLTDFFRKGLYKSEINLDNPLGCRGQLAEAYADLINEIWSGKNSYTVPRSFKFNLSRFAPQFTGFQQQDSQELLAFLLDGLHEDLNRIKKKPYVEMGSHVGKSDEEFAEESWQDHKKRNDSIIVDIFHGLLKSTLNCLVCNEISVKFDPFCYLSVPLPSKKEMLVQLVLVPLDQSKPLVKFKCPVMKSGNIQDLCASLEAMIEKEGFNLPKSHMVVAEVYSNKIFKIFDSNDNVSTIKERDEIYVYELPDSFYSKDYFKVVLNMKEKNVYKYSSSFCGIPILLMLPNSIPLTYGSLYQQVYQNVKRFFQPDNLDASLSDEINSKLNNSLNVNDSEHEVNMDDDDDVVTDSSQTNLRTSDRLKQKAQRSKKLFTLYVTRGDSYDYEGAPQDMSDDAAFDLTKYSQAATFNQAVCLLADFNSFSSQKGYNKKVYEQPEEHDSCSTLLTKKKECIKLSDCFNLYTKMEELSEQDYWYCSKCKAHQRSTKKFDLWSLPKVLVVHLKRFSYSRYHRDKIDSLVDFPVHDLDMSSYLIGKKTAENKYSLIAVSNHYGSLGGGHYTAYGMNRTDGKWYYFDDSCVSSSDESSVCTSAAYVLFYLRNDLYKEYIGSDAVDATVVNGDDSVNDQENMDL